tara:strand:- start:316 stop:1398 length:1083 start_codon:yes stop_codon:yes gene_type:complete
MKLFKTLLHSFYILKVLSQQCIVDQGYSWCDTSNKCLNTDLEPCLPITKDCILCISSGLTSCGKDCSINIISNLRYEGFLGTDENGCSLSGHSSWCSSLNRCIDTSIDICRDDKPEYQDILCHNVDCAMYCEHGFQTDKNGCNICICNGNSINTCGFPEQTCSDKICTKITEITECSQGGIIGHTTYQLSIIINDYDETNPQNIYALFGDGSHTELDGLNMLIPPAYQTNAKAIFNAHLGGIPDDVLMYSPTSRYDSWLTIGITNGDRSHSLSSLGVDLDNWSESNGIIVSNGAIFLLDPNEQTVDGPEYVIAQLTLPSNTPRQVLVNIQGQYLNNLRYSDWNEKGIVFNINPPNNSPRH